VQEMLKRELRGLGDYWIDENNNVWNCLNHNKQLAQKHSKSLKNCFNCTNCYGLENVSGYVYNALRGHK
jgi:hypothetical protein